MKAKESFPDTVSVVSAITELEWQTFLQGPVLANMLDEEVLQNYDGKYLYFVSPKDKPWCLVSAKCDLSHFTWHSSRDRIVD